MQEIAGPGINSLPALQRLPLCSGLGAGPIHAQLWEQACVPQRPHSSQGVCSPKGAVKHQPHLALRKPLGCCSCGKGLLRLASCCGGQEAAKPTRGRATEPFCPGCGQAPVDCTCGQSPCDLGAKLLPRWGARLEGEEPSSIWGEWGYRAWDLVEPGPKLPRTQVCVLPFPGSPSGQDC